MAVKLVLLLTLAVAVFVIVFKNTRTPDTVGIHQGRLSPLPSTPNAVSSQTDDRTRQVAPLPFSGSLEQTRTAMLEAIRSYPGTVRIETETPFYIHCVFTTDVLRFRDDVEFLLDGQNRLIHFRSASRVGYSDLGANRRRYETLAGLYHREG
jgi:uncharacterized protein (DUF1499 family)